jgi:O-antigen ligase
LVTVTALHLCFLPWALGTMQAWSQLTSLGLAGVGFILALLPRTHAAALGQTVVIPTPITRLRAFPVFWAGLLLLAYIAVQGCNPAWRYVSNANSWWLEPVTPILWLPSGVAAPLGQSNPWRVLVIFGSLWLLICSVWTGFNRRQSYRILFTVLAVNALLVALLGGLQLLSGTKLIFWSYPPSNSSFSASFIYPNHAGAYFNLMVALATGLAWWHYRRARHGLEKPGVAALFLLIAAATGSMVVLTTSRTSILLLLVFTALIGFSLSLRLIRQKRSTRTRAKFLPVGLALAGFLGICVLTLQSPRVWTRFSELLANPASVSRDRVVARHAAWEMLRDHWLLGWGAGCFQYGFPLYAQKYPDIYIGAGGEPKLWEHAHDDLLEFPLELGTLGVLPLIGAAGWGVWQLGRCRFWRNGLALCVVAGGALLLVHAWVDFVFQNPAVLLTWAVLLSGALRWVELDEPVRRASRLSPQTACTRGPAASSPP